MDELILSEMVWVSFANEGYALGQLEIITQIYTDLTGKKALWSSGYQCWFDAETESDFAAIDRAVLQAKEVGYAA